MTPRVIRPVGLGLAGLALLVSLSACVSPDIRSVQAPGFDEPMAVVAEVVQEEGPQVNQWGGVVPEAKPSTPVDDGGLGEIGS